MARHTFRGLDLVFGVSATDPAVRAVLHGLFDENATEETPVMQFAIESRDDGFVVCADGEEVLRTEHSSFAVAHMVWEINRAVVGHSRRASLLLHASAVQRGERAVLFAGPSGSGKSTIAAALVTAGLGYLTDDVVALDAGDGSVAAYRKPIGLGRDVLSLFPALDVLPRAWRMHMGDEWYVTPSMLGGTPDVTADVTPDLAAPVLVVFPDYAPGAPDRPEPRSRAETLVGLAENSFNFLDHGAASLDLVGRMLSGCECYRFEFSNVQRVVEFVNEWLGRRAAPVGIR